MGCRKKILLFIVICYLIIPGCFAENELSLRLAPAVEVPFGSSQFGTGIGATASLDWAFLPLAYGSQLGIFAAGGFASIPVEAGDPMSLFEGKAGPFIRWRLHDRWTFRSGLAGGVYQYSRGEDSAAKALWSFALGAEFHLSPYFTIFAEGGYSYRAFSSAQTLSTMGASAGIKLNLSEIMGSRVRVKVEKTEQRRVFPVSWAWYVDNPIAMVKVTNEEPNSITDVNLSFFMDSYMGQPWTFASVPRLGPGESAELPVTALFNEAMLNLIENINSNGEIQIQYRSLGSRKESFLAIQMPIFHRNALSWDDDRRAAAFVSARDSSARLFARYVAGAVEAQIQQQRPVSRVVSNTPMNVRYAAAMFEALRLYGINYVIVPATSYAKLSEDESVLDSVSYPYQSLYYRGGDCSYLAILYCSLLEALDIETAFITIPGHIYAAFEVGDNNWSANNDNIIEIDGRRWLPVEITVPSEGFSRAWRIGAREWKNAGIDAALYPMRESWKFYPPVTVPASGDHPPEMPPRLDIVLAMEAELNR